MPSKYYRLMVLLGALVFLSAAAEEEIGDFTMWGEFAKIRELHGPELPTETEQVLLERYRPRLYSPAGQPGPLDFYADYIANGCLQGSSTKLQDCEVDQADLNAVRLDPNARFTHVPPDAPTTPVGYGAIYRGTVVLPGLEPEQREWIFLRYNFTFARSGIAAGVKPWQAFILELAGDLHDWHQLDNYTAAVVALDENEQPMAVMLQQHNYMHTYLVGVDPAFPVDGPFAIDIAVRSNEFYPHRATPKQHRATDFLKGQTAAWLVGTGRRRLKDTLDHTAPDQEVDYRLKFLPPADAFYVFVGRLGAKRSLPGRDGPPGAIYYTLPALWRYEVALPMFYWQDEDTEFVELMQDAKLAKFDPVDVLPVQRQRLTEAFVAAGLVK